MKNFLLFFVASLLFSMSCKEKPIVFEEPTSGARRVLVEELTGVRCTQCPNGARQLEDLQGVYGKDKLIVVSIHAAGNFSVPYTESKYDFRSPTNTALAQFIGASLGYPTSSINRVVPTGNNSPFILQTKWAGIIAAEFAKDYGLDMAIGNTYDEASRRLSTNVTIAPSRDIAGDYFITALILEDKIKDYQLDNGTKLSDYVHRHVLRGAISAPTGDALGSKLVKDALITKSFSFNIPNEWNADNCSVVAFVHRGGTPDKEVLQAIEKYVKQ